MKRVLLVEDDFDLSSSILLGIDLIGIPDLEKETKLDGSGAMARVKTLPAPDLLILDMHLPHVSGQEIYEVVRHEIPSCKVIIITADVALAREIHNKTGDWKILPAPDGIFPKPFSLAEFQGSVREILGV